MHHGYTVRACLRDATSWRGKDAIQYLEKLPGVEIHAGVCVHTAHPVSTRACSSVPLDMAKNYTDATALRRHCEFAQAATSSSRAAMMPPLPVVSGYFTWRPCSEILQTVRDWRRFL